MAQVTRYTDRQAYTADENRLDTKSAISYIQSEAAILYDGVNSVVDKSAAAVGDLAVFDKTVGVIKFIKGATVVKAQIPASLIPLAVVYARQGERVLIVSLDYATYNGSDLIRWAAPYEVALSGFNLTAGGAFTLKIYATDYAVTYMAGATLENIASAINATLAASTPSPVRAEYGGWAAAAVGDRVIMSSNSCAAQWTTIEVVSGCTITRTPENASYQTTPTGILIEGVVEFVRRKNGVNSSSAGYNRELFLQYKSGNGSEKTGQSPGSTEIICESVFTHEDNPDLVAAYPTYKDYLFGEHLMQYPAAYGAMLRDGKTNTGLVGPLRFVDIYSNSVPCYPAAAASLNYGVSVEGAATGLEAGAWWLPSVEETYLLLRDRVLAPADQERDPVNRTLARMGKTACYGAGYNLWTSCECDIYYAFVYGSYSGDVIIHLKHRANSVRPVCAL